MSACRLRFVYAGDLPQCMQMTGNSEQNSREVIMSANGSICFESSE
ncbi:hypothetical protein Mpsy_0462 [Methanolobus psychrophilus R15]|nr:hypothetical protein Mpsy_0462 [Methanolobus psychrophilus R15]